MKKILAIITFVSSISFAQFNPSPGTDRGLVENTRRLARITFEQVDMNADRVSDQQLRRVNELMREISRTMSNGSQPPPYNPPPYNPAPPTSRYTIAGVIENSTFNFSVFNLQELYDQCAIFVQDNRISTVDDISISVNYGPTRSVKNNNSYWRGMSQICMQMTALAKADGVYYNPSAGRSVIGTIETFEFNFRAYDKASLSDQCTQFVNGNNIRSVDDIVMSVDFGQAIVLKNNTSYWKNSFEICQQIIQNIR